MDRRDWIKLAVWSAWANLSGIRASMAGQRRGATIVVVGAGIAGLSAARELAAQGFQVTVLEGRQRIGGRIWTERSLSAPVDLGAASIEIQRRNPLTPLARQWQIAVKPLRYESTRLYDSAGAHWDENEVEKIADRLEGRVNRERIRARADAAKHSPRKLREQLPSTLQSVQDAVADAALQDPTKARQAAGPHHDEVSQLLFADLDDLSRHAPEAG